jgi:hypothetical protein
MAVQIQWQPPVVLEARKRARWEWIIRRELGDIDDTLEVSLRFEEKELGWMVDAAAPVEGPQFAQRSRDRVASALRSVGMPAL